MTALPEDDCFAIRQAARYVSQLYDRHMAKVGLRTAQFSLLTHLFNRNGMTMQQLADTMVMDRTTLVRALQPLRREGLVVSLAAEGSKRAARLSLSDTGRTRLGAANLHWRAAQDEFEQRFGVERAAALRRELFSMTRD